MSVFCVVDQFQNEVCSIMCDRLKLSTWRVQLGVLCALKVFYQRYSILKTFKVLEQMLCFCEIYATIFLTLIVL